jgi:hypothetical protein
MLRNTALFLYAMVFLLGTASCSKELDFGFKDLCFYHPHTAPVKLNVDWSKFWHIEQPMGMSVYVWPDDPTQEFKKILSHDLNGVTLNLLEGSYKSFIFNQSETEFSTIEFFNLDNFNKAEVRVKQTKSNWYSSTKEPSTKIGEEPEWMAIDCIEDISVTEEMVKIAEEEYLASIGKGARMSTRVNEIATLVPKSVIKCIDIYIRFDNMFYLRSALAALEDMAEGCYISTRETTGNKVTHTVNSWRVIYDKDANGNDNLMKGMLKTTISTFGLPAGHTGTPEETTFFMKLLLVDQETILTHTFKLGEIIADLNSWDGTQVDENGNAIWPAIYLEWPEPLPIVKPVGSGDSAFDVGVSDWGDEIVTILPML